MPSLAGKHALVTGASRGIGAAIALRLARDGAHVALTYERRADDAQRTAEAVRAHGVRAQVIQADCADPAAVRAAVDGAAGALGGLDILVNNAGIAPFARVEDFALADFDRLYAVNIRAVFVAIQAALAYLPDGGRIVNIGSCNAERMPFAGGAPYAMSKAALVGLAKGLARDLGPRGITVNTVQPGPVDTDMNPADGPFAEQLRAHVLALPRYAQPDEIAGMVAWLAGPDAAYVTGASLTVDGGFTA
jgi:3-oxoacyl-[acyl-carrier protein] reductase